MRIPRALRNLTLVALAAISLSACAGGGVVPGAYGVAGEWMPAYRPMPDKIDLASKDAPQAFMARYDRTLDHCKAIVSGNGISVKSEIAAGTLKGGVGGAAGGALTYMPYPPADMAMGAGLNGIFGAVTGSINGADYGVTMQKSSINQCMFDNGISVIPTGKSNWTAEDLFGQPVDRASYQQQPAQQQSSVEPRYDNRPTAQSYAPPPTQSQHWSEHVEGNAADVGNAYDQLMQRLCQTQPTACSR